MGNPINPNLLEKKRKFLLKTTVQLPQDYTRRFGTQHGRRYIVRETNMADVKMKR